MYSFELVLPLEGATVLVNVVFVGHQTANYRWLRRGLSDILESYNRRVPPSRLLFICPLGIETQLKNCFGILKEVWQPRLNSATHVIIAPYSNEGLLEHDRVVVLKAETSNWALDSDLLECLGHKAVEYIFENTKSVLRAPHGYTFRKPSNQEANIFVRTGNMLRDPSSLAVFSFMLIRRLPQNCEILYIDSLTILSFALGLQSLVDYFRKQIPELPVLDIENFHSYYLDEMFRVPNEDNYLVLISATTSGGLANKLVHEKNANKDRILHIVGVGPQHSEYQRSCVHYMERDQDGDSPNFAGQKNAIISIASEEFLISESPPNTVRLTREHVNLNGSQELHRAFYIKALKFGTPSTGSGYSTFSIASESKRRRSFPFQKWINQCLINELPASISALVHLDDSLSTALCSWIRQALPNHNVAMKGLRNIKEFEGQSMINKAVVVVAFQDPGMENLRAANIHLRQMTDVHRHFVIGYAFPNTHKEHAQLQNDLRMKADGTKYGWSEYFVLPVGDNSLHESLASGSPFFNAEEVNSVRSKLNPLLADKLRSRSTGSTSHIHSFFLPRVDGTDLVLRDGSVFFSRFPPNGVSQVAVYAMVASTLQRAREGISRKTQSDSSQLVHFDDNPFVRNVLDPSMFARFNDGILQASLLRSTQPSELDYSASIELSQEFASICTRIFECCEVNVGEAALEFIYAVKAKKVALRSSEKGRLNSLIAQHTKLDAFSRLLEKENSMFRTQ